jgi:CO/xanthine dehydrogenase FAD-binding subunit
MEFLQPETWAEALQMKAAHPQAVPIQGGTDVMVELNFDRYRPEYLLDLTRVDELAQWAPENGRIRLGAGVTYTRVITELGDRLPGLATPTPRCWPRTHTSRPSRCAACGRSRPRSSTPA